MDSGWKFALGEISGAEQPKFDDAGWRALSVPHDWSIEGPFAETNRTGGAGGFLPGGIGWYRKPFTLPAADAQRRVFVDFDGVMANSDVWVNGFHLGQRPYGYVSLHYELTGHVQFGEGKTNLLAVRADNSAQPASRWYSGAGIYRHVRLVVTDPVHLDRWGPFVTTPQVSSNQAFIHIQTTVLNQSEEPREVVIESTLLAPDGRPVRSARSQPQTIAAGKATVFQQELTLDHPQLWDAVRPAPGPASLIPPPSTLTPQPLYRLSTKVHSGSATLDEALTTFGIREVRFEAATGFWLNGKNLKLKGVCLHHDAGDLGAAVPLGAWERRLELLKQVGCNAIRTAHNPVAPEFLDLCDRMGFVVMDELFDCWTAGKNRYDYHLYFKEWSKDDLRDTVCRDRNHPSVVVYSAGNEIRDTPQAELAKGILRGLVEDFHQYDPSRPVSQALFRPNASHDYDDGLADLLDVIGQNYREDEILAAHEAKPERKILGTENGHDRKVWLALRDHPPYAGQFLWTGFDYLGESRRWPVVGAGSGLFDRTGTPRARAFQRQSWWSDQPMVHIVRRVTPEEATPADPGFNPLTRRQQEFSDWTPNSPGPHPEEVEVYSNCEQVELMLNGKSLGSLPLPADAAPRAWKVPFEPGMIKAVGKDNDRAVATHELRTAGKPAKIVLATDRARLATDWDDLCYVSATITDANGVLVPDATALITFKLSGPGRIAAVDSGDNASHEPFQANTRHAYQGRCTAILKAAAPSGPITLTASAPGLASATVTVEAGGSLKAKSPAVQHCPAVDLAQSCLRGFGPPQGAPAAAESSPRSSMAPNPLIEAILPRSQIPRSDALTLPRSDAPTLPSTSPPTLNPQPSAHLKPHQSTY
jgi:beta-galactosidase